MSKPTVENLVEKLGQIDVDKVSQAYEERNSEADKLLAGLQDWIDDYGNKFTDWEIDFVNSVTDWRENNRDITVSQLETLNKLYKRVEDLV